MKNTMIIIDPHYTYYKEYLEWLKKIEQNEKQLLRENKLKRILK